VTDQLTELAKPFPQRFIAKNPTGFGNYVTHSVVTEKLLKVHGPFDWRIVEVLRGDTEILTNVIVGIIGEITLTIDGRTVTVQEVGDCERPENWKHDGQRLKDAQSDCIKRAAMRAAGVAIHLWSGEHFSLYQALKRDADKQETSEPFEVAENG